MPVQPPSYICPDCGLSAPRPVEAAPFVCAACVAAAPPRPAAGWPLEDRWVSAGRGRGVFATRGVLKGELVERCWIMPLSEEESTSSLGMPVLNRYLFPWTDGRRAIISGAGLLYNFNRAETTGISPNVLCVIRRGLSAIEFWALRDIARGEEYTWDYQRATVRTRA